jgi:chemotaxis protein methyltransferase CheR
MSNLSKPPEPVDNVDIEVRLLLEAIYLKFHYDFRGYSMASVKRRLTHALPTFGCATISALQQKILYEPDVFGALLQYLTVQVSDMFRDPAYFRVFRERIVPELRTYPSLKLWVAGCSTGEEVYSFAIILREEGLLERTIIYATDINTESLRKVEAGVFPLHRVADFSDNHQKTGAPCSLSTYYTAAYGSAAFDRSLMKQVVLSDHSLATDTVFAEVQLVSCRNVLIYFDRALQDRASRLFRDSLCRRGFLGIGAKESMRFSSEAKHFANYAPIERWYSRC